MRQAQQAISIVVRQEAPARNTMLLRLSFCLAQVRSDSRYRIPLGQQASVSCTGCLALMKAHCMHY